MFGIKINPYQYTRKRGESHFKNTYCWLDLIGITVNHQNIFCTENAIVAIIIPHASLFL